VGGVGQRSDHQRQRGPNEEPVRSEAKHRERWKGRPYAT
jgi:hypothetical protein